MAWVVLLAVAAADVRRVEVDPSFGDPPPSVEIDRLIVPPEGPAVLKSTRGWAASPRVHAEEYAVGTRLVIVFTSRNLDGRHSLAELTVEAGEGTQRLVAAEVADSDGGAVRTFETTAEGLTLREPRLLLPLPEGVRSVDDERSDRDGLVPVPPGFWAVPAGRARSGYRENPASVGPLLSGRAYEVTAAAEGRVPKAVRFEVGPEPVRVDLDAAPPLRLAFRSPTGRPLEGVRVWAWPAFEDGGVRVWSPVMRSHGDPASVPPFGDVWKDHYAPRATSEKDGRVELSDLLGGRPYDVYADAGNQGRGFLAGVTAGDDRTLDLSPAPPLVVAVAGPPGGRFSLQEQVGRELSVSAVAHGPYPLDAAGQAEVAIPSPLADEMAITVGGPELKTPWTGILHVNARGAGRRVEIDATGTATDFFVDPALAEPRRMVTVRFPLPDGTFARPLRLAAEGDVPAVWRAVVSRYRPARGEESGSYRDTPFQAAGDGWAAEFAAGEAVRFMLGRTRFDDAVIDGRPFADVPPGEGDAVIDVPMRPARTVRLHAEDFAAIGGSGHAWLPFAAAGLVRDGNDALSSSRRQDGRLWTDVLDLPAAPTLLIVNPEGKAAARLLPPDSADVRVDWSDAKRTVVEGVSFDGTPVSARITGLAALRSGIEEPVEVRYATEKRADGGAYASRAVLDLTTDTPLAAVVVGYTPGIAGDTEPQVVPLTPGETHSLTFHLGNVLWADFMTPDGRAVRDVRNADLSWLSDEGVRVRVEKSSYVARFVGVPRDRPLTLELRSYEWPGRTGLQRGAVTLDPSGHFGDESAAVGVVVEPGPPGELRLTPDWTRTLPGRDGNRARFLERDGRR